MKFLTVSVVFSFTVCIVFTVVVLILGALGYEISDTLIQYFFMTFGLELGASAAIKITKHVIKRKEIENTVKEIKENNLELTKEDLKPNDSNDIYDCDYEDGSYMG